MTKRVNITSEMKTLAEAQIKNKQREISYDTVDHTIEHIVDKFSKKEFYVPEYQRRYIWPNSKKNLFLESLFLGLPIPFMFLACCLDGRHEIIDGVQRIQTITEFCDNRLQISGMRKLSRLNGFQYLDLPNSVKRKFDNRILRIIILDENTPNESRQDLFNRINTTSEKANPSEIRRGSYPGPFTAFVEKCSKNELFIRLAPMKKKREDRYERFEFVLRFFAYSNNYINSTGTIEDFLDEYLIEKNKSFDEEAFLDDFEQMLDFVEKTFPNGFAKTENAKSTPRVRFEAIAVGSSLALKAKPNLHVTDIEWLHSNQFKVHTTSDASNNSGKLKARIEYVRDCLLQDK